jgi:hypothetical protein
MDVSRSQSRSVQAEDERYARFLADLKAQHDTEAAQIEEGYKKDIDQA